MSLGSGPGPGGCSGCALEKLLALQGSNYGCKELVTGTDLRQSGPESNLDVDYLHAFLSRDAQRPRRHLINSSGGLA